MCKKLWLAGAVIAVAIGVPVAEAAGFCSFTATEAWNACKNDAWVDNHNTRGACANESDEAERLDCFRQARRDVLEALELCLDQRAAREEVCDELGSGRYDPPFDPEDFVDPDAKGAITNPFLSLTPGGTSVLRVGVEGDELVVIHVTDEVKLIEGVPCRVVVDVELDVVAGKGGAVEYDPREVTDDWFALHESGDVWYCGELSRNFDDGELASLGGSFQAGVDGAKAGILIRAVPIVGELHRQEFALNEAEDLSETLSTAASPPEDKGGAFDCGGACLQTREFSPLEPDGEEYKFYLPGVGFVLALELEDGELTGDREALVCAGDSLDVLADPACGIEDVEALLDLLCELHPDAFCDDSGD